MARIRSVHPGLFTDEAFVTLSSDAQVFLIGLWTEADDQGVFEWKPVTLRMRLRPSKDGAVESLLDDLLAANAICHYEIGGRKYGAIRNFRKYQRPKAPNAVHPITDEIRIYVSLAKPISEIDEAEGKPFPPNGEILQQREDGGGSGRGRKQADAEDARARPPLIRPEAFDLADELARLCGHDPQFLPAAFCGAPMRVESWLAHGWQREMILTAVQGVLTKRSGKPPDSVNYFEKPIAEFIAKAARPLPEVVIDNTPEKLHVRTETNSAIAGADRILERMREFDQPAGGGDGSPNHVRLLSQG